ncbi:MAG: tripartite tricarboxylate transporter TctB family protein [Deltaproteobacteria bacterium]|jgi:hypothetical protein|nr:tripartite tricarboxylate transporter TctB family protein [Deltaproteobacteria bacterium]
MRETPSGFLFLGLSLFVVGESLRMGTGTMKEPGAGFLSLWAGVILAVFALALIIRGWKADKGAARVRHSGVTLIALIALFVYSLIMDVAGFVVATFFLMAVLFHLAQRRPWWALLGISALVTAVAYVVFGIILKVYFPVGFLGI